MNLQMNNIDQKTFKTSFDVTNIWGKAEQEFIYLKVYTNRVIKSLSVNGISLKSGL